MKLIFRSRLSIFLVIVQFTCIILLAVRGIIISINFFTLIIQILFILLGVWALISMKFRFNVSPDLLEGSEFINIGPYKYIRHPMYLATLGVTLCWILPDFNLILFIIWLILLIDLLIKIHYEENILKQKFIFYQQYTKQTKKLLPFIY
ncbi:MAG: methyltransferase family protein [Ignavibacteria bacterium]